MSAEPGRSVAARLRIVAAIAGLALIAWLVRSAGPRHVLDAIRETRSYWIAIVLLEAVYTAAETVGASIMLGPARRRVPMAMWVVSTARAYASQILLPAGRAVGEALRAATLSRAVGGGAAAVISVRVHARVLLGNAVMSLIAATVARGVSMGLAWSLVANAVACATLSTVLLALTSERAPAAARRAAQRWTRAAAFVEKCARKLGASAEPRAEARPPAALATGVARGLAASVAILVGRVAQTVQYGIALYAVGGASSPVSALLAQGIHVIGATAGDFIPGQLGANEGSFRLFAATLGFRDDPARALALPLVVRLAQLALAFACLLLGARPTTAPATEETEETA